MKNLKSNENSFGFGLYSNINHRRLKVSTELNSFSSIIRWRFAILFAFLFTTRGKQTARREREKSKKKQAEEKKDAVVQ